MINLQLIENQPHWRVWVVAWFARIMGVCIHVEGIPFGSNRIRAKRRAAKADLGETTAQSAQQIGSPQA